MDNFKIDIVADGTENLGRALLLAFCYCPGKKATHFIHDREKGLIFLWHKEGDALPLPAGLTSQEATIIASKWLEETDYPKAPDHDGDNEKAWRVYNEAWGHVAQYHYAICAFKPVWAVFGK